MKADLGSRFAVTCIDGYQKHLSPRKGWCCAHRVLHGGESCSAFVKRAILENGWREAIAVSKHRFAECKDAAFTLRSVARSAEDENDSAKTRREKRHKSCRRRCDDCFDCLPSSCDPPFCGSGIRSGADAVFDCGPGDTGCIDCSPCDCNAFS